MNSKNAKKQIEAAGAATAKEHKAADAACGREWECRCGACNIERRKIDDSAYYESPRWRTADLEARLIYAEESLEYFSRRVKALRAQLGRPENKEIRK